MLHNKSYLKRGRGGKVFKAVKEHYLRDDIWCSVECCTICSHTEPILSSIPAKTKLVTKPHYIIPDTNVFMNQVSSTSERFFYDDFYLCAHSYFYI